MPVVESDALVDLKLFWQLSASNKLSMLRRTCRGNVILSFFFSSDVSCLSLETTAVVRDPRAQGEGSCAHS